MRPRHTILVVTMLLALAAVRGTRIGMDDMTLRILTWIAATAIAVLTVASIRVPDTRWIVPTTTALTFGLLLVPPSPARWFAWMPDSLVALLVLAFLSQLYRLEVEGAPDTQRRDRLGAITRALPLAGGFAAVITLPSLYARILPDRLAAGFEFGSALGPLAAGLSVATAIAVYVLLRTVIAPGTHAGQEEVADAA